MNICRKVVTSRNLFMGKNMKIMTKDCYKRTVQRFCTSVLTHSNKYDPKKEKNEFLQTLPIIIDDLSKHQKFQEIPDAEKWMRKVLNGTVVGGKYARGLTTVMSYKLIENPENVTEETLRLARTLGWCTEILQAYYLVLDDIADGSTTRRGLPCWYQRDDVGIANATNDAVLIHACLQQVLRTNFARLPFYVDLLHNFGETLLFSSIGQNIDIMTGPYKKNYNSFTIDQYNTLVEHKSAYYTYKLPITLGIMLANKINDETLKNAQEISMQLGRLFQMQDDYIDCYGDEKLTGKMGTDIQEGKCSWLAVNALQRCKANQRAVFNACYGSKEPAHIERIKQLYNQLKIPQLYTEEETKIYNHTIQRIQTVSSDAERELYLKVLIDTYGRKRLLQLSSKRLTSTNISLSQIKEREVFNDVLPCIIGNLQSSAKISQVPEIGSWIRKVLEHNLTGGKHSRGMMTMLAYEMLEKPENVTEKYLQLSRVLGWCVEMLQAYFIVVDDIMDGSSTRRGMPCWYRMPNVGLGAINDSILIYCSIMETLETYFGKTPQFVDVMRLFNEALLFTSMGQHLDFTMAQHLKDYSLFTIDRYESIVQYKTSCYTFRLPILLGLVLAQDIDKIMYAHVDDICLKLGRLFQMQDDFIDCFGDESVTGKAGTDIQEGKCSWLAVTALQRCNKSQKALFTQYYGSKDSEHVKIIKQLYEELRLPELYRQEETEIHDAILQRVRALPSETAPNFFLKLVDQIYKRKH